MILLINYIILNKLLEIDPEKRIKAKDAMNHPYFKS